ncbi:MAG: hypothetical protein RJA57_2027 [Bacteroidota bacterium]|jgi:hypothetical protein
MTTSFPLPDDPGTNETIRHIMALNKNHEFEELNGIKCGIVERNVGPDRLEFLKTILEFNGYTVVTAPTPPPKTAAAPAGADAPAPEPAPEPVTVTLGVTDYTFNWVNAIFGRQLRTRDGQHVTLTYWQQKDPINNEEIPYFEQP